MLPVAQLTEQMGVLRSCPFVVRTVDGAEGACCCDQSRLVTCRCCKRALRAGPGGRGCWLRSSRRACTWSRRSRMLTLQLSEPQHAAANAALRAATCGCKTLRAACCRSQSRVLLPLSLPCAVPPDNLMSVILSRRCKQLSERRNRRKMPDNVVSVIKSRRCQQRSLRGGRGGRGLTIWYRSSSPVGASSALRGGTGGRFRWSWSPWRA